MLDHVLRDSSLGHLDSELEQFAVQPRCSPQDIGSTHVANQLPNLLRNPGSTNPSPTTLPFPVEPKSSSIPGDDRIRLDEQEAVTPFGPEAGKKDPQNPIRCPEPKPFLICSLQDNELVAESQDFHL